MMVQVPIELLEKAITEWCNGNYSTNTRAQLLTLLEAAKQHQASGELNRWEAYEAASREERVKNDHFTGEWTFRNGTLVGRNPEINPGGEWYPWYAIRAWFSNTGVTGWRIVRPEPPTMGFMEAAKQCAEAVDKEMMVAGADPPVHFCFCNRLWSSVATETHFFSTYLNFRWLVRSRSTGNYYTATGEVWDGKS